MLTETASQTAGPYLHIGMMPAAAGLDLAWGHDWNVLAGPEVAGRRIRLEGMILDGTDSVVRDAMVEIWQADAQGRYAHPAFSREKPRAGAFRGFGRAVADFQTGLWWFDTVKPGPVQGRHGAAMAPHVNLAIFARGINIQLQTRIYFADEAAANAKDPVLRLVEQEKRRETLLAHPDEGQGQLVYRFTVRLQGAQETVFFDV